MASIEELDLNFSFFNVNILAYTVQLLILQWQFSSLAVTYTPYSFVMNYTPKRVAIFLEWSKSILSNEWDTSLNFLCHSWTYLHRQVFFLPCNLETLQSQQIFALPFSNDKVSKPSWVCPAHLVLITVPFLPLKFCSFFQSKHVTSISLIAEADEVQLTSLRQRKEETRFGRLFFAIKLKFHSTSKDQPMNVETASSIPGSSSP